MGGNGRRDQQTTARQTPSSSGGRQSEHVRKTPPPDGLVLPLSADEHQDATDVCAHTDNLGCGLFWHVSYAASLRGAQFCRFIFFSFLFMNDEAECRRHSILLRICSPSTLQTFQKRECLSLSIYIYISLHLYTLKWNVHFRETNCSEKNRHSVLMEEDCCRKQEKAGLWRG